MEGGDDPMPRYEDLDPRKLADWQIAEAVEENMPTPEQWRDKLELKKDDYPHGEVVSTRLHEDYRPPEKQA
jgi:hypothetical protein